MYQYACKWRNIEELPELSGNISKKKLQQSCIVMYLSLFISLSNGIVGLD